MNEWFSWPIIASAVTVITIISTLIYKILAWKIRTDNDNDNDIDHLKDSTDSDRKLIHDIAKEIREDIKKILVLVNPNTSIASNSPYQLTEFGEKISDQIGAVEWANNLAPSLLSEIQGMEPFEIDEFCKSYVPDRLTEHWSRLISICSYEMGTEKSNVEVVLEVVLRDTLLRLSKNQ